MKTQDIRNISSNVSSIEDPPDVEMVSFDTTVMTPPRDNKTHPSVASPDDGEKDKNTSRRPMDVALTQQRMKSWQPLLDSRYVIVTYLIIGVVFLIVGFVIQEKSNGVIELIRVYEDHTPPDTPGLLSMTKMTTESTTDVATVSGCKIGNNPNKGYINNETCQITFQVPTDKGDLQPPVLVHYQINNFYQNYRTYQVSYDMAQLLGSLTQNSVSAKLCDPLNVMRNSSGAKIRINPCGLIANTLFNDVFKLDSIVDPNGIPIENAVMNETGIAWRSDLKYKYRQPKGFKYEKCPSCDECSCEGSDWSCKKYYESPNGTCYRYYYPNDDTTQYLYETYPMTVSPIEGVLNEHFVVWMRTAALPNFRKLYGYIDVVIPAGSTITFSVQPNWAVVQSQSSKALVISDNYIFGGKNKWLGVLFMVVGGIAAGFGLFFLVIQLFFPRKLGDRRYLKVKVD